MKCPNCNKEVNTEIGACIDHIESPLTFKDGLEDIGYTPVQFAKETGTPLPTVYCWANGSRKAPPIAFWAVEQLGKGTK